MKNLIFHIIFWDEMYINVSVTNEDDDEPQGRFVDYHSVDNEIKNCFCHS